MSMNPNREKELIDLYKFSDIELLRYFKNNPLSIAFFPLSKRLYTKKKYLEVIKISKKCVELFDDFNDARILLAKAYTKTEQYSDAVQELKKIIKIDPNYADAYYYISEILFAQKATEKAKVILTKAYELAPEAGHIKNSFNKYFKSSTETVANYIVEQTIVTSLEDLKKYDSKLDIDKTLPKININEEKTIALDIYQNKQVIDDLRVNKKDTGKNNVTEDLSFLDDLEKEFGYGKYKKYFFIFSGLLVVFILFSVLFSIIQSQKQQILNTQRKEIIKELNNDLKKIDVFKENKLNDVLNYYKLLYYYEIDSTKYIEIQQYIKSLKPESFYQYLSKMAYYLFELEFELFDEIYEKLKIENSENPDIFIFKGYQLILKNDLLNASNQFILAYEKSQKELRYKLALSYLYQKQNNFGNSFELLKDITTYDIEIDILKTLAENNTNTEIVSGLISFTKEDNLKIKLYIYLLNYYQKKSDFNKINDVLKIIGDGVNNKYYKKILENFKIK